MLKIVTEYPLAFVAAVAVHLALGAVLTLSFSWAPRATPVAVNTEEVVQATAVEERAVQAEIDKLRAREERRRRDEQARVDRLEQQADAARTQREAEQKRLAELEAQHKIEAERKRRAEVDRTKAEQASRAAVAERERQEQARSKAEAERKQAEEIARKTKQEAIELGKRQQALEEARLREQSLAEDSGQLQEQQVAERQVKAVVDKHTLLLKQKVERSWIKPANARPGMLCTVLVRLSPAGDVLDARVTKSSGDPIYDRSVETAVRRAEPFQVPDDPAVFARFRELKFEFNPK